MRARMTPTQQRILINALHGRPLDHGRPSGRSAAGGWDCAIRSCYRHGWLDAATGELSEAGKVGLGQVATPKLTEAQFRIMLYMARTGAALVRGNWGTAWTRDEYQWPVSGITVNFLADARFIERDPGSNEREVLKLTVTGMSALEATLKRLVAQQEAVQ